MLFHLKYRMHRLADAIKLAMSDIDRYDVLQMCADLDSDFDVFRAARELNDQEVEVTVIDETGETPRNTNHPAPAMEILTNVAFLFASQHETEEAPFTTIITVNADRTEVEFRYIKA